MESNSAQINFSPGSSNVVCTTVQTIADSTLENTISVPLLFETSDQAITTIIPSNISLLTILDDDGKIHSYLQ